MNKEIIEKIYSGELHLASIIRPEVSDKGLTFLTEDELEAYVDNIAGSRYYQTAVEESSPKFQLPSEKYEPIIPDSNGT